MMLPEGQGLHPGHGKLPAGSSASSTSPPTGAIARVRLPIFSDHCVLDSIDGVLLLQRDHDTSIRLLHPFTGDIADFPPLDTLLPYVSHSLMGDKWFRLRNVEAAAISVATGGVVSLTMWVFGMVYVSFATSGDKQWRVSTNKLENDEQFLRSIIIPRLVDLMLGMVVPVSTIGCNALFLGKRNMCVNSNAFPTNVGDAIVFYHHTDYYLAQYHLGSGTLSPASERRLTVNFIPSPTSIIYHIYTCCFNRAMEQGTDKLSGRNQGVAGEKKVEKGGARKQLPFYAGDAWFSFRDRHYVDFSTGKVAP